MEQAIIEIGPHIARFRGVDGFWVGQVEINQVPRESVMHLLGRVEQKNMEERERVVRFLMDVGWRAEAKQELDRLVKDFPSPDLKERAAIARQYLQQLEAEKRRSEIDVSRKAQQYHRVAELLKSFNEKGIPTELLVEVREIERHDLQQRAADQAMAADLRKLVDQLPSATRKSWKEPVAEVLKAIEEAPDAVRDRLAAWRKARSQTAGRPRGAVRPGDVGLCRGARAGRAGAEGGRDALEGSRARPRLSRPPATRPCAPSGWPSSTSSTGAPWPRPTDMVRRLEVLDADRPAHAPAVARRATGVEKTKLHRVLEEENDAPTEYAVRLPPEYHPLRSYPAIVVLHSGDGPNKALDQWEAEAARRGYILIAPEYSEPGKPADYRYTTSEHAAVELALRDARKRYAIDSDRVFAAGQLVGGNMAWDYALAHPDQFAGVVVISGLPAKYVPRYLPHHERLPLFYVIGELAPAANSSSTKSM